MRDLPDATKLGCGLAFASNKLVFDDWRLRQEERNFWDLSAWTLTRICMS